MDLKELQRHWNRFGEKDPYWAILTDDEKRGGRWNHDEFFATGVAEITALMTKVDALESPPLRRRALDFGCGAGRLTQALAGHFDRVAGVDIASSMIDLARRHNRVGARCECFLNETDGLGIFENGAFDLVYSILVLQHMRPDFAKGYLREFGRVLAPGGLLVFQIPAQAEAAASPPAVIPTGSFRARHPSAHRLLTTLGVTWLYRGLRGVVSPTGDKPTEGLVFEPVMEMNCVPREEVEGVLRTGGLRILKIEPHPMPGFTSYVYWAQRPGR